MKHEPVVEWVGHEDGSTAFMIIEHNAEWKQVDYEFGMWWDVIIKDWEQIK